MPEQRACFDQGCWIGEEQAVNKPRPWICSSFEAVVFLFGDSKNCIASFALWPVCWLAWSICVGKHFLD